LLHGKGVDPVSRDIREIIARCERGERPQHGEVTRLLEARGADFAAVASAADGLRRQRCGDTVSYVVNRNINYTNVCYFKCRFCAFSKGRDNADLRGRPYDISGDEIARRCREAWDRGATEVCMQGGIHPDYTGDTYVDIVRTVREAAPGLHVHAFSPLEVWQGAATLGLSLDEFLQRLRDAGLDTLPGTAAEVLHDDVRAELCPDKLNSAQWLEVMEAAHRTGFRTTATIMFGHIDRAEHWSSHLLAIRDLQARTGGFTEFVPLPFVHMEAPMYRRGKSRKGPTFREAVLMHAVPRLVFNGLIDNIQASWVKLGREGVAACLAAGANDLGGSLMNESITRAAGAAHGQEWSPRGMETFIDGVGRTPRMRTTLYADASEERRALAHSAPLLVPLVNTPAGRHQSVKRPAAHPGSEELALYGVQQQVVMLAACN
jgi:FO synthase